MRNPVPLDSQAVYNHVSNILGKPRLPTERKRWPAGVKQGGHKQKQPAR